MTQMNTPEVTLAKALEFLKTQDEDNTIMIINDFILYSKKKYWTANHEQLIMILIELSIKKNKLKSLRDGLNYYRGISQNINIDSLATMLTKTKELVEDKFIKAQKSYQGIKIDIQDLDSEDSPELLFLYSFDDGTDTREKEQLINSQKFIWETYKILLDLTKTNSKLLTLYAQILKSAFNFCKENRRKVEFKRLCDSVRGYLQTLIKTEKKQFFQNKVQISRPEVLKTLIQIRISLLDTATELEQWQEAFKTAEDIIFLMDKYEKQIKDESLGKGKIDLKAKKLTKIPPLMKLEFYANIEKLLWISDYHLYHAHSTILIKELAIKAQKWIQSVKSVDKQKDSLLKLDKFDLGNVNNRLILGALVTPFKNSYTNYLNIGDELFEYDKEIDTQTCSRMMGILKLNQAPSRKNLINFILSNKILDESNVDENIRSLFNLLENETNPLVIGKKVSNIIQILRTNSTFEKFADQIEKNLTLKIILLLTRNYESISFKRLLQIFPWTTRENLEDIISENTRIRLIQCTIDHSKDLVKFKNSENVLNSFDQKLNNFLTSVEKISCNILTVKSDNKENLSNLRDKLYHEIHSHNTNSLVIYDALILHMDKTNSKLTEYLKEKRNYKERLRESELAKRKEAKEKAEEESKAMREVLKDDQRKKEFEQQLKKYLIDRIRIYTNIVFIDGKKIRLDDLLSDLTKVSDEYLINLLEKVEFEFKTKKEKKFKQTAVDTDYIIREFRKRDFEIYTKTLTEEENIYNQLLEEENKKSYNEKIGMKSNLLRIKNHKQNYFNDIIADREKIYNEKMNEFTQSLEKKIREDMLKDIGPFFKAYVEDFRKKEEESLAKSNWKPQNTFTMMKKGDKFVKDDRSSKLPSTVPLEFKKGSNLAPVTGEPRKEGVVTEFKKGERLLTSDTMTGRPEFTRSVPQANVTEKKDIGFTRGVIAPREEPRKTEEVIKTSDVGFKRGVMAPKEEAKKIEDIKTSDTGFKRGGNVITKEEPKKTEDITRPTFSRKVEETPKTTTTSGGFGRRVEETPKTTTTTSGGFGRRVEETPKTTTTPSTGGFGRKIDETPKPTPAKKEESKPAVDWKRGAK